MTTPKLHPSETPEYWDGLAERELAFAREDMRRRTAPVESIRAHRQNAADYTRHAAQLRAKATQA